MRTDFLKLDADNRELGLAGWVRADGQGRFVVRGLPEGRTVELWARDGAHLPVKAKAGATGLQVPFMPRPER